MPLVVFSWVDMVHTHRPGAVYDMCTGSRHILTQTVIAYGWLRLPAFSGWSNRTFVMGRKAEDASQ